MYSLRADREVVLAAVQKHGGALGLATEALRADREVVRAAVQKTGFALEHATKALRADHEIVLEAVRKHGGALSYATEALRADREVVQAAVQQEAAALRWVADEMLEDPSFAPEAKRKFHLLKVTLLSGRSTVVAAWDGWHVNNVYAQCRRRLGLADDGATMELWHCSGERVPDGPTTKVRHLPGLQPKGEIS
eukprot:2357570-Amphidinium_carterae.1